ncbi:MAG TPA: dipeptidase [Bacteroidales bacterium]|nr:dipeptidase [Bacteroidales bacterium]HPS15587.1 dipeptidase [Bacteroidales bacterium]
MEDLKKYIESNSKQFLNELFEFLRIPSVSAKPEHKDDMYKACDYIKNKLMNAGADTVEIINTKGHPIVYGEKIIDKTKPTVLVYGHYDVQPPEPLDLWKSKPFEPEIRDERIYARGADDDKGQLFMHIKAFEYLVSKNKLLCNVKFMFEGEEEVGSVNLEEFCKNNKERLKCDIILVSDTAMIAQNTPSITVGLRGLTYMEVEVTGPCRDLHSGHFGGAVANPANILAKMIASLTDNDNCITIPGFYDDVLILTDAERTEINKAPFDMEHYKKQIAINEVQGEKGYTTIERVGIRPSLDVNGMWSGYIGEGAKTVLPSKAGAKISMRLVPNQNPEKIAKLFEKYFLSIAPNSVNVTVKSLHGGNGFVAPTNTIGYAAASKAFETTYNKKPIPVRGGGSIPIISLFEKELGAKSILMGFGLESDAIHSPNESFTLYNFYKGIETIPYFYKYFAEMMK